MSDVFARYRRALPWERKPRGNKKTLRNRLARSRMKTETDTIVREAFDADPTQGAGAFMTNSPEWLRERAIFECMECDW